MRSKRFNSVMGVLNLFLITFSNGSGIYYAGSLVNGYVTIDLKEPMKMRGIRLKFLGKAYVHWTEDEHHGHDHDDDSHLKSYSADEIYFDEEILLFGIWPGKNNTEELPAGTHTYPFKFQLPPGLPSSFEAITGYVRYIVTSYIDRPWKFDFTTKLPFTVIGVLDLNHVPHAAIERNSSKHKYVCCLCCKSGPIQATFHIDRSGYVPGEAIKLFAEIINDSSRKISKSYVSLQMSTTFYAKTRLKTVEKDVSKIVPPGIAAHSGDVWSGEELIVPPLPPSFLNGCQIIDIHYYLQLTVDPFGPGSDLKIPLEIFIGTIPLASVVQQAPPKAPSPNYMDRMYAWGTAPSPSSVKLYPLPPPSSLPNLPPPKYNEAITGPFNIKEQGDDEHLMGNLNYAPVYPYYNWGHAPSALPDQTSNH
ncbi:hypothetical protein Btru_065541 [Bulinus truncatus]|nr:hypothetical protein Btru_065541 [Bulinus truncatus]